MRWTIGGLVLAVSLWTSIGTAQTNFTASDPEVRIEVGSSGGPLSGLTKRQLAFFNAGKDAFQGIEGVADGLGPRFNLTICGGCHAQPTTGGTSPAHNPQADIPQQFPNNTLPSFISVDGPVREARFKRLANGAPDGGVHDLFVIDCGITQEDYEAQLAQNNVIFRIPTPVFGSGLIEGIPDSAIVANAQANSGTK